jgi:stearoyl-CoA desaturase (delta-9 desaturase)
VFGRRRYTTSDTSRNFAPVALLTMGEGWHNNHHHHPATARQGVRWWEIDMAYWVLRGLAAVRIVRDLREPTEAVLAARRVQPDSVRDDATGRHPREPHREYAASR